MEVVLTADNNHTLLGTLVLEDIRLVATPSPAKTTPLPQDYDDRGATMYAVAVILVYGFSIVLLIASHTYMKRKNGKRGEGEDMSTVNKYLEQVPQLQEISRKDSFRRLKMSIIPMVSIAIGRDITELPSKPIVPPTPPPRSPIVSLIHNIHDKLLTTTADEDSAPNSPTSPTSPRSVRFDMNNEGDPFGTSKYTPLLRSLSQRSGTSGRGGVGVGREGLGDTWRDLEVYGGQGAGDGAGGTGGESADRQTIAVSHISLGEAAGATSAGAKHLGTATGAIEPTERKAELGAAAQPIPVIRVKLPAFQAYVRLLSTSSGVSTVSAYSDQSSPCSPSSTASPSFHDKLAESCSSGVASDFQASFASNRFWTESEQLPSSSRSPRHHSPAASAPGVHQPKLLVHVPVQEVVRVGPPGSRWADYPQRQVVEVGGTAQGEDREEEPLVPFQITTV